MFAPSNLLLHRLIGKRFMTSGTHSRIVKQKKYPLIFATDGGIGFL